MIDIMMVLPTSSSYLLFWSGTAFHEKNCMNLLYDLMTAIDLIFILFAYRT